MKKFFLGLTVLFLVTGFYGCKDDAELNCSNAIKDGDETEIDCGGSCDDCPPVASLYCRLGSNFNPGSSQYFGRSVGAQVLGPSIRVFSEDANDIRPLNFMFIPQAVNQPIQISAVSFVYNGEAYTKGTGDSGVVVLTAHDTLRNIISGTFYFSGVRVTGSQRAVATEGVFANVRYPGF